MITKQTAGDIWAAHNEIEKAQKLIEDMEAAIKEGRDPNPQDSFGRSRCLQMGVPSGENSQRLFNVDPKLAIAVIRAHIADRTAELAKANQRAHIELQAS